jgi:hypothetical protein
MPDDDVAIDDTIGSGAGPSEADAAAGARASVGEAVAAKAARRRGPAPPSTEAKPLQPGQNPYDAFDGDPQDDGIALAERGRLNRQDAFYRGSLPGSVRLALLSNIWKTPDADGTTPETKAVNQQMRDEYQSVVADLAAYDEMQPFGTTMEAMVALQGQLEGTLIDPDQLGGLGVQGRDVGD